MSLFRVATVVLVSMVSSLPAGADPIVVTSVVTSGNITTVSPSIPSSTFTFSGDGLSLSGFLSEGGFLGCTPCPEGAQQVRSFYGGDMGTAAGTVLGTNYPKLWLGG